MGEKKEVKVEERELTPSPSEKIVTIQQAINYVQKSIGAIAKLGKNREQGGYPFRKIDDVYNAMQKPLAEAGLYWTFSIEVLKDEVRNTKSGGTMNFVRLNVVYRLCHTSGVSIDPFCEIVAEGLDSSDKAIPKAMSMAHKLMITQMFCIATDEPKDPENDTLEAAPQEEKKPKGGNGQKAPAQPQGSDNPFRIDVMKEIGAILDKKLNGENAFTDEKRSEIRNEVKKARSMAALTAIKETLLKELNLIVDEKSKPQEVKDGAVA